MANNVDAFREGTITLLDDVYHSLIGKQEDDAGNIATIMDSRVVKRMDTDKSAETRMVQSFGRGFKKRGSGEEFNEVSTYFGQQQTIVPIAWGSKLTVDDFLVRKEQWPLIKNNAANFIKEAKEVMDEQLWQTYLDFFVGDTITTPDGMPVISANHELNSGEVVDNLITGPLNAGNIRLARERMMGMKDINGRPLKRVPRTLVVSSDLYHEGIIETQTRLAPNSLGIGAANDINVVDSEFGMNILHTPYLNDGFGGNSNAWFLLADDHPIERWVAQDLDMETFYDYSTRQYASTFQFEHTFSAPSYQGIVGSLG